MKHNYTIKRTLSAMLLLMMSTLSWGYGFEVDGIYYNINYDGESVSVTYKDTNYGSYSGDIVIPSTVTYDNKTYSVTSIGYKAFSDCSSLTSIYIPNSVTRIGESAFRNCSSLTSIHISISMTRIENYTFINCSSLTHVDLFNVTSIGDYAFSHCESLGEFGSVNVTSIGNSAFWDCSSLTHVFLPPSVTSIGRNAFYYCKSITSISIPDGVSSIGDHAFGHCPQLATVVCYAKNVPKLGDNVLYNVPTSKVTLYVPASALEKYKAAWYWKDFGKILPIE